MYIYESEGVKFVVVSPEEEACLKVIEEAVLTTVFEVDNNDLRENLETIFDSSLGANGLFLREINVK